MATSAINVGTLRAILTADSAQWTAGFRTAASEHEKFKSKFKTSNDSVIAGMSASGKAASSSGQLIAGMGASGRKAAADQAVAAQAALTYSGRLKMLGAEALGAAKGSTLLGGTVGKMTAAFGAAAIIGTVATFIKNIGVNALESAGKLSDMSAATGLSVKTLQQMDAVAQQTGTTLETFSKASFQMGVRIQSGSDKVKDALAGIGLEHQKIKALKIEDQWAAVVKALEKEENQQRRNEAGMILMGKTYQEVAASIEQGYTDMAKDAVVAGDAQIAALDATGDAWSRLMKTASAGVTHFLGSIALAAQGFADANFIDKMKAIASGPFGFQEMAKRGQEAALMAKYLKEAQDQANKSLTTGATVTSSYSQQLAKVRAELAALTPAQRKEIAAAQALGVEQDKLEDKFGLTEGALKFLTDATRANEDATKLSVKLAFEAADAYRKYQDAVADVVKDMHKLAVANSNAMNEQAAKQAEKSADAMLQSFNRRTEAQRDAAQTSQDIEEQRAEFAIEQAKRHGATWQQVYAMEKALADQRLQRTIDQAQLEFEIRTSWIDRTTAHGEAEYQALKRAHDLAVQGMVERHQQAEELKREEVRKSHSLWHQSFERMKDIGNQLVGSVSQNFSEMLLGAKGFKDGFVSIWQSIKSSVINILSDILNQFIGTFLKGMLGAITGQRGAFSSALGGLLGGGGGGVGGLFGQGGGVAMSASGGLFGGGGAAAGGATGGGAAAGAAGGGGMGSLGAFFTNPFTIGAAAGAALGLAIWKKGLFRGGAEALHVNPRRDRSLSQFGDPANKGVGGAGHNLAALLTGHGAGEGGGELFRAYQKADTVPAWEAAQAAVAKFLRRAGVQMQEFERGGLVRGRFGMAVPAVLHGGEGVLSRVGMQNVGGPEGLKALNTGGAPSPTIVNINVSVRSWDAIDSARWFRTQGIHEIKQGILLNTGGLGTAIAGAS